MTEAYVVTVGRNHVWVLLDGEHDPRTAELRKTQTREMLVPGDRVETVLRDDGSAFVLHRRERRSVVERTTPGGRHKTLAANIDTVLIAAAFAEPLPNLVMIDEVLAFAQARALDAALLWSKADMVDDVERERLLALYRDIGYPVFEVDARVGYGVTAIEAALQGRITLVLGASGVGKSTLFAALGGISTTGAVSEKTGRGRQTTTAGRLHRLADGVLIDSPGIGEFALEGEEPENVALLWREFAPFLGGCRFIDCRHDREPSCTLRAAVEAGLIAPSRWQSYRRVVERLQR